MLVPRCLFVYCFFIVFFFIVGGAETGCIRIGIGE